MIIKICGITRLEDALDAIEAGADFLGYNFYPGSTRFIDENTCLEIQDQLDKRSIQRTTIGIFVNTEPAKIGRILDKCGLDMAQLSGNETPEAAQQLGGRAYQSIRPRNRKEAVDALAGLAERTRPPMFLLDTYQKGQFGGSGKSGDWNLARQLAFDHPFLLAGGLNPENVAAAIREVNPWGVDVASGVENQAGLKDRDKIRRFVRNARQASPFPPDPSRRSWHLEGFHAEESNTGALS